MAEIYMAVWSTVSTVTKYLPVLLGVRANPILWSFNRFAAFFRCVFVVRTFFLCRFMFFLGYDRVFVFIFVAFGTVIVVIYSIVISSPPAGVMSWAVVVSWWYPYPGFVNSCGLPKDVDLFSDEIYRSSVLFPCLIRKIIFPENG